MGEPEKPVAKLAPALWSEACATPSGWLSDPPVPVGKPLPNPVPEGNPPPVPVGRGKEVGKLPVKVSESSKFFGPWKEGSAEEVLARARRREGMRECILDTQYQIEQMKGGKRDLNRRSRRRNEC